MFKQLKAYGLEESFPLPNLDYDDWSNEVVQEIAENNLPFINSLLIRKNKLLRISDLIDNKHEIIEAQKLKFKSRKTKECISSLLDLYRFSEELVEFSDLDASEDIVVISHIKNNGKDLINFYILKKVMNIVMTDKEIIEVIGKELSSFGFMSHKTMEFVNFLSNLTLQSKKEKEMVFILDLLTLPNQVDHL